MNKEQAEMLLAQFIFDELDAPTRRQVQALLDEDAELREQVADMRMAAKLIEQADVLAGPAPTLSEASHKRLLRQAENRGRASRGRRWSGGRWGGGGSWAVIGSLLTVRSGLAVAALVLLGLGLAGVLMPSLSRARYSAGYAYDTNAAGESMDGYFLDDDGRDGLMDNRASDRPAAENEPARNRRGPTQDDAAAFDPTPTDDPVVLSLPVSPEDQRNQALQGGIGSPGDRPPRLNRPARLKRPAESIREGGRDLNRVDTDGSAEYFGPGLAPVEGLKTDASDVPAAPGSRWSQVQSRSEILAYPREWAGASQNGHVAPGGEVAAGGQARLSQEMPAARPARQAKPSPDPQPGQPIVLGDMPVIGRAVGTDGDGSGSARGVSDAAGPTSDFSRNVERERKVAGALGVIVDRKDITVLDGSGLGGELKNESRTPESSQPSLPEPVELPRRVKMRQEALDKQVEQLSERLAVDPEMILRRAEAQMYSGDVSAARRSLDDLSNDMGWDADEDGGVETARRLRETRDLRQTVVDEDRLRASVRGLERQFDLAYRSGAVDGEEMAAEAAEKLVESSEALAVEQQYFKTPAPVIKPGQTLALSLHGKAEEEVAHEQGAWQFEVSPSGWAEVPGVGPMRVAGLTAEQVAQRVAQAGEGRTEASAIIVDAIRDARADVGEIADQSRASVTSKPTHERAVSGPVHRQAAEELPPARAFKLTPPNPWVLTERDRQSTFALDVDTASYALCRRYIHSGYLPPRGAVRMEEFINYFDYNYPDQADRTFAVHVQAAGNPFDRPGEQTTLLKVGVKGKVLGRAGRKAAHLVFVVDTSGSMARADRLPLVAGSLAMLLGELDSGDRISLVTYGQEARLLLDGVPADNPAPIRQVLENLQTGGSTNLLEGLTLGYRLAAKHFESGQINRVILCSDGVANLGETESQAMLDQVDEYRRQGIACTTVGFGHGAYNDALMEDLANKGDGSYLFIDSAAEARRVFVDQMAATLQTIAADAKIQVEFNPLRVRRYRLIGYENRDIADEDFRNDTVDAGEVGSGQSSTALYELELIGEAVDRAWADLGTAYVRYRDVDTGQVAEISRRIESSDIQSLSVSRAPRFYLAAAAAKFAEVLRGSPYASHVNLPQVRRVIEEVAVALPLDQRVAELADLVRAADGLPPAP